MDNRLISVGENVIPNVDIRLMKEISDKYGWNDGYRKYMTSFLKENHGKTLKVLKEYNSKLILTNGKDNFVIQSEMVNPIRKNANFSISIDTESCSIVLTQEYVEKSVPNSFSFHTPNGFGIKRCDSLEMCGDCIYIRGKGSSQILTEKRFDNFLSLNIYLEHLKEAFIILNDKNFDS